jgi:hypothetical protein
MRHKKSHKVRLSRRLNASTSLGAHHPCTPPTTSGSSGRARPVTIACQVGLISAWGARISARMALPSVRRLSALLGTSSSHEALCAGAQIYVNFLSLTRRSGFLQGHISKQTDSSPEEAALARAALEIAAERHLAFMELRKELPTAVPTRDISVVWHADLLRPTVGMIRQHEEAEEASTAWFDHQQHRLLQSGATFEKATGRRWSVAHALWQGGAWGLIGAGLFKHPGAAVAGAVAGAASSYDYESGAKVVGAALKRFDPDASGIVTAQERSEALAAWQRQYDVTAARWRDNEATEYRVPPGQMALVGPRRLANVAEQQRREALATELADAVASQASFTGRILALGPKVINDEWIGRAVTRYGHFLALARAHPGKMLVPTLDVDLIWCVHLRPPTPWQALTRAADAVTLTNPSADRLLRSRQARAHAHASRLPRRLRGHARQAALTRRTAGQDRARRGIREHQVVVAHFARRAVCLPAAARCTARLRVVRRVRLVRVGRC